MPNSFAFAHRSGGAGDDGDAPAFVFVPEAVSLATGSSGERTTAAIFMVHMRSDEIL
jgi:hypothetical protein